MLQLSFDPLLLPLLAPSFYHSFATRLFIHSFQIYCHIIIPFMNYYPIKCPASESLHSTANTHIPTANLFTQHPGFWQALVCMLTEAATASSLSFLAPCSASDAQSFQSQSCTFIITWLSTSYLLSYRSVLSANVYDHSDAFKSILLPILDEITSAT
ncbi:hypothetical protein BDR03DRAFT_954463 [Suillus americanus]|nr:hypothetical protein BDR03DRAFT_954463 [Suillus americanus]